MEVKLEVLLIGMILLPLMLMMLLSWNEEEEECKRLVDGSSSSSSTSFFPLSNIVEGDAEEAIDKEEDEGHNGGRLVMGRRV